MKNVKVLEHLKYIGKRTFKGHALYLSLKEISLADKELVFQILNSYQENQVCTLFPLPENNFLAFFNNNKLQDMMMLSLKLRKELKKDTFEINLYNLKTEYSALYNRIYQQTVEPQEEKTLADLNFLRNIPSQELTYEELLNCLNVLKTADIAHLIRHQPIVQTKKEKVNLFCMHIDCYLNDIRQALFSTINIQENPFLEQILKEAVALKIWGNMKKIFPMQTALFLPLSYIKGKEMQNNFIPEIPFMHFLYYKNIYGTLGDLPEKSILSFATVPKFLNMNEIKSFIKIPFGEIDNIAIQQKDKVIIDSIKDKISFKIAQEKGFSLFQGEYITKYTKGLL